MLNGSNKVAAQAIPPISIQPSAPPEYNQSVQIEMKENEKKEKIVPELFECSARDYIQYWCLGLFIQPAAACTIGIKLKEKCNCLRHVFLYLVFFAILIAIIAAYYVLGIAKAITGGAVQAANNGDVNANDFFNTGINNVFSDVTNELQSGIDLFGDITGNIQNSVESELNNAVNTLNNFGNEVENGINSLFGNEILDGINDIQENVENVFNQNSQSRFLEEANDTLNMIYTPIMGALGGILGFVGILILFSMISQRQNVIIIRNNSI